MKREGIIDGDKNHVAKKKKKGKERIRGRESLRRDTRKDVEEEKLRRTK